MADTVKVQWQAYLGEGRLLLSDMGRVLMSFEADSSAGHDTFNAMSNRAWNDAKYGGGAVHSMAPNARDRFAVALAKEGLGRRDIGPSRQPVQGCSSSRTDRSRWRGASTQPGAEVVLRAEMDVLVALTVTPHVLDPRPEYTVSPLEITAVAGVAAGADDPIRTATPEAQRAFENTDDWLLPGAGTPMSGGAGERPSGVVLDETVGGPGAVVARRARGARSLRIVDLEGNQAVDFLLYVADDPIERYSAADTMAAQGNVFLTTGIGPASNEGTPMMTITASTVERHDTIGGACSRESNTLRYGHHTNHQHACVDNFLHEHVAPRHGQARHGVEHQLVHERPRRGRRHARHRRRHLGARSVRRAARRDGRARRRVELPADQQPVQRVRPDAGADDRDRTDLNAMGSRPFERVLVANRGEIACRIIGTLDRLGIESVAVHSDADRGSLHVAMASIAVPLGRCRAAPTATCAATPSSRRPSTPRPMRSTPATASSRSTPSSRRRARRPASCSSVPTPEQIRQFGSKHVARELAARAGVPLVPGSGLLVDVDAARRAAETIGYPVMFKASAGGGGIGLRRCNGTDEIETAFDSVRRLAAAELR